MYQFIQSMRLTCLVLFIPFMTIAQQTDFGINRSISLSGTTSEERIIINVEPGSVELVLKIRSLIRKGGLEIEITDPSGEKQGNFSVESQISAGDNKDESVEGRINKRIKNPIPGLWVVTLKSTGAHGRISLNSQLIYPKKSQ